jgi:NAD(P)-dependent dehydrogenase (short-subunit alcohol dehydrogenase family)
MFSNKLVVITGANRGIGFAATSALFTHGAQTVMACRNVELGRQSVREHRKVQGGPQPIVSPLDLSNLASVHEFAEGVIKRFGQAPDILINNAAVLLKDRHKNTKTVDGFDETFQVNYLAPALLTLLFLKEGIVAERIIHVSAGVHKTVDTQLNDLQLLSSGGGGGWDGWKAYCHSKRLQVLFSNKLARLAEGQGQPDPKFPLIPENQPMSICVDPGYFLIHSKVNWG